MSGFKFFENLINVLSQLLKSLKMVTFLFIINDIIVINSLAIIYGGYMRFCAFALILILFLASVSQAQNQSTNLSSWKKVNACGVKFNLPLNAKAVKVHPVDSCVKQYQDEDIVIELDVIFSSFSPRDEKVFRSLDSDDPEFQVREIQIASIPSLIVSCYKSTVSKEKSGMNYFS
ncbi:MAG TPA: hypothetical protein PKY82_34445, partial [Pyrinomonadaceae bacterium]|nr:hypothetical protein [Pyrinomonadaceae bacterium]